jgi:hypothetical protein
MDWGWLGRRWMLVVLLPLLAYVFSIPVSFIVYAVSGNIRMASNILNDGFNTCLGLGIVLFLLYVALSIVRPIKDAPKVGLRHVFPFYALFAVMMLVLYEIVLSIKHGTSFALPPMEGLALVAFFDFTWSLIPTGLVAIGLFVHNYAVKYSEELGRDLPHLPPQALRGLLIALPIIPALTVALAFSIMKSVLEASIVTLTVGLNAVIIFIIFTLVYRRSG